MEPVINFSHVTKEYPLYHHIGSGIKDLVFHPKRAFQLLKGRKYLAIEDITFTVGKGEAVALIGRNGAGKSTSLGLVAGVIKPTKALLQPRGALPQCLS
jgi:lipopolysaccharide transport system ATP-binding protein